MTEQEIMHGGALEAVPLRLRPGVDLRGGLGEFAAQHALHAAFVLSGIGSLARARLRFASQPEATVLEGDLELLSLAGSLAADGMHLHAAIADAQGRVYGGHVAPGCIVRTTAELLVVALGGWRFRREADAATGYRELHVQRDPGG